MPLYNQSKPIDIQQLQVRHQGLAFEVKKSDTIVTPDTQHLIDQDSIIQLLKENGVKAITITPNTSGNTSFMCRLNHKKIVLITKTAVKKTTYQLVIPTLALTINDRASDESMLASFIQKIEHILQLVKAEKATAYGR